LFIKKFTYSDFPPRFSEKKKGLLHLAPTVQRQETISFWLLLKIQVSVLERISFANFFAYLSLNYEQTEPLGVPTYAVGQWSNADTSAFPFGLSVLHLNPLSPKSKGDVVNLI